MASSQTSSHSQKRDQIIDGRLFSRSTVMDRIISEVEDDGNMEQIISKIEEQGLYRLGRSHPELYDELKVEEFYRVATVKTHSRKHGGGIISISASIQDISICINQDLLVSMFGLPSDGLTMEELESFGFDELLTAYWGLFTGKSSNKDVHPSCPKKKFCLPFVFLHDFAAESSKIELAHSTPSKSAKKIGTGKFIGGFKPSAYHQAGPFANRPFLNQMPSAKNPRGVSSKTSVAEDESSRKRKRSGSDSKSPLVEKKKHKKASKSNLRGVPIPEHDPTLHRVPSPSRDPTPDRVPTPVKNSSPIPDPTPVDDPIPTENLIPVRSPSPAAQSIVQKVEQAFARFIKWKSYTTAPYDVLINWKDLKEEEEFILNVTDSKEILLLFKMDNEDCKELIYSHYLDLDSRSTHPVQPDSTPVPVAVSGKAERQQEPESTPVPVSSEPGPSHAAASTSIRRPESPRSVARKEQLNALGRQSLFLQDAVEALYQVGKEMDWLNLTASEEMESAKVELSRIAVALSTLPQDLKEAIANFQKLEEQLLLKEQLQLHTVESKTVAVLEYTDSRISDHDQDPLNGQIHLLLR
ncbi:hypothetical protein OROMI_012637 [Orobanche minor]